MVKFLLIIASWLFHTVLAETCASIGGDPVDIAFGGATKLKFYGVSESDIAVTRMTGPLKMVVKNSSATVTHSINGDTLEVFVGTCGDGSSSTTGEAETSSARGASFSSLPVVAALALGRPHFAGLLMAGGAAAQSSTGTCTNFVSVEIYTPAATPAPTPEVVAACPDPSAVNEAMVSKMAIFDSPTNVEMEKIFDFFTTFDFSSEGADITFHPTNRGGVKGRTPKPDSTKIAALFGNDSLATSQKASPVVAGEDPIWGGIQTTYISRIDPCQIPKADAIAYLYGNGAAPGRYACVNVAFGSLAVPKFVEYRVGPLDADTYTATKLKNQIWGSRPREGTEMQALKTMVDMILNEDDMKQIQMESFDGKWHGNGLNNHEPAPPGMVAAERHTQILINFHIEGTWRGKDLNVVPLSFTIDNSHGDPSMWTADKFYYNMQGPFTRDELVTKYNDGNLTKVVLNSGHYEMINGRPKAVVGTSFPTRRTDAPHRDHAQKAGPTPIMPDGPRFEVKGRHVKWMDWEFHAGYTFRSGPDVKGITFKGNRVAYQVALNEVSLQYGANDPVSGNVFFFDCTFGNGEYRELIRGVDCPHHATYIDNYWWAPNGGARDAKRATCIFEHATDSPLWRRGGPFVSGIPNVELHMRAMLTNGNYDYMLTYKFKLDGSFEVDFESTGFIQTHFYPTNWPPRNSQSSRVAQYTGGSVHDHTYGMKVDLDVGTQSNTFQTMEFKTSPKTAALNTDNTENWAECDKDLGDFACDKANMKTYTDADTPYLLYPHARHTDLVTIQTESEARVNANPATPKMWLFGDSTNLNKWGNPKQYAIKLHDITQNGLPDNHYSMPANSFAKQNMAVTVHKEEEYWITGNYDLNRFWLDDAGTVMGSEMNVDKMVEDNQNIVQQDLVLWLGLATMHYPTSENMPMTTGIKHGFSVHPHNFFDENPSMDLPNYLRMMPGETGERGCEENCYKDDLPTTPTCATRPLDVSHDFAGVW